MPGLNLRDETTEPAVSSTGSDVQRHDGDTVCIVIRGDGRGGQRGTVDDRDEVVRANAIWIASKVNSICNRIDGHRTRSTAGRLRAFSDDTVGNRIDATPDNTQLTHCLRGRPSLHVWIHLTEHGYLVTGG